LVRLPHLPGEGKPILLWHHDVHQAKVIGTRPKCLQAVITIGAKCDRIFLELEMLLENKPEVGIVFEQ
jgi:hypothetical protein